jgi:hypothetical protein
MCRCLHGDLNLGHPRGLRLLTSGRVEAQAPLHQSLALGAFAREPPTTSFPYKNIKAYLTDG